MIRYVPHTDGGRIPAYLECAVVGGAGKNRSEGVPSEIQTGCDLEKGLAYGNHRSTVKYYGWPGETMKTRGMSVNADTN